MAQMNTGSFFCLFDLYISVKCIAKYAYSVLRTRIILKHIHLILFCFDLEVCLFHLFL